MESLVFGRQRNEGAWFVISQGKILKDKIFTRQLGTVPLQRQGASLSAKQYNDEATLLLWSTFSPASRNILVFLYTAPWPRKWDTAPSFPASELAVTTLARFPRENSAAHALPLLVLVPLNYCLGCWDKLSSLAVQTGLSYQQATAEAVWFSFLISSGAG